MAIPKSKWIWLGQAGHFICANDCRFHLHTHVGAYCVSTVGDYWPRSAESDKPTTIGHARLYETMVFRLDETGETDGRELVMRPYQTRDAANRGHRAMCERWSKKEE